MNRRGFMKLAAGLVGVFTTMSIPVPAPVKEKVGFSKRELEDLRKANGGPVYYLAT